jgi:poly(3-hydroxybutyrate) depolymerase
VENEFGIEQSKAFATGLFQGAQIVFQYMKDRYSLISEAEGKSDTGYKAGCA